MYGEQSVSREIPRTLQVLSSESLTGQAAFAPRARAPPRQRFGVPRSSRAVRGTGLHESHLMRTTPIGLVDAPRLAHRGFACVWPSAALPDTGMVGVGASVGVDIPSAAALDKGLDLAVNIEGYLTPRVSVRGQLGGAWWDIVGQRFTGTVKPLYVDGNIVYNWEGGAVHPYVTAGIGMYRFRFEQAGLEGSDTKAGFNVGGGVEVLLYAARDGHRRSALSQGRLVRDAGHGVRRRVVLAHRDGDENLLLTRAI